MKNLLFLLVFLIAMQANATVYPLMGVVVDGGGRDVSPLSIVVEGKNKTYTAFLKSGGLYYTDALPEGTYDVTINLPYGSYSTKVVLKAPQKGKKALFYNFRITDRQLIVDKGTDDPFAVAVLNEVKEKSLSFDVAPGSFIAEQQDFNLLPVQSGGKFMVVSVDSVEAGLKNKKTPILNYTPTPIYWDYIKQRRR